MREFIFEKIKKKFRFPINFFSIFLLFFISCSYRSQVPTVQTGVLELSNYDWNNGYLNLDGNWEFYKNQFLKTEDLLHGSQPQYTYISVPGDWNGIISSIGVEGFGYGTYVLNIRGNSSPNLLLKIQYISTAAEIEYMGQILYSSGVLGDSSVGHIPDREPTILYLENTPSDFSLIIRVSNFTRSTGGLVSSIRMGTKNQIHGIAEYLNLRDFFNLGSLLVLGFYHLFVFLRKFNKITYLFFSLVCLNLAARVLVSGEHSLLNPYQGSAYELFLRIEYVTLPLGLIFMSSYILSLTEEKTYLNWGKSLLIPGAILVIIEFTFSPYIVTKLLIVNHIYFIIFSTYILFILFRGYFQNNRYSRSILISIIGLISMIINDILNRYYIINTFSMVQYGFIFFIFFQAYIITSKYSEELTETEHKKRVSESLARELDYKVRERTEELQKQGLKLTFQKTEIENMNLLLKYLNEDLRIEIIAEKLKEYISFRFNIQNILLARYDFTSKILKTNITLLPDISEHSTLDYIKNLELRVDHLSIHEKIINSNRVFWLRNSKKQSKNPEEKKFLSLVGCESMVFIPLFLNKEPIAFLYLFIYNNFKIGKNDMHHLTVIGEQIGSSIFNAWLIEETNKNREITESAMRNLKESQNLLVQAEKMAALEQMVSGIAHEINTPIGAIKATAKNIHSTIAALVTYAPALMKKLDEPTIEQITKLIDESEKNPPISSTKEERAYKKKFQLHLEERGVPASSEISDALSILKFTEISDEFEILWFHPEIYNIIKFVMDMAGLRHKSKLIDVSVDKTSKIIYALKAFTQRDSSGRAMYFDIPIGIDAVLAIYENNFKSGIELNKYYDENLPQIKCHPDELNQVWTNLIHNAIQAVKGKGKLIIAVTKVIGGRTGDRDEIQVSIKDNGGGIPEEIQKKIFDPFFTTKKAGEGTGLGLHICREIVRKHEGDIQFFSRPGETNFVVSLPIQTEIE